MHIANGILVLYNTNVHLSTIRADLSKRSPSEDQVTGGNFRTMYPLKLVTANGGTFLCKYKSSKCNAIVC